MVKLDSQSKTIKTNCSYIGLDVSQVVWDLSYPTDTVAIPGPLATEVTKLEI